MELHFGGGLLGLLWLVATIWAIVSIVSSRSTPGAKALWIVLILVLPLLGLILWFFLGPKGG